ncbi:MAG: extracellular solute-binding protein [Caldicoprobacterales bacterium]
MKKRIFSIIVVAILVLGLALTGCDKSSGPAKVEDDPNVSSINIYSFTDEVPSMLKKYAELNSDFNLTINETIRATDTGAYQPALDTALQSGGSSAPDIYTAEAAFVLKYTQGGASSYAAPYKDLGIDVDNLIKEAKIAQYTVDIGTRPSDKNVVGLGYQATGGAFIYRRSIAKDVWGTDDPKEIEKKIGPGMDKFFDAAEELKAKGYAIISGDGDLWHAVENSSEKGWIVDGKLHIDKKREAFLDLSKRLKDNGYHNDTADWTEAWYADMKDAGEKKVFGFFGPAWLINYVILDHSGYDPDEGEMGTFGDWAICVPPEGFFWGGTWVLGNKDTKIKQTVGKIIQWITLDSSDTGLQYMWANGTFSEGGGKDTVASAAVMERSDGKLDFLGGQDMFEIFVPAGENASGKNMTEFDEDINSFWREQVNEYVAGSKSREQAIEDFKKQVKDELDIDAE